MGKPPVVALLALAGLSNAAAAAAQEPARDEPPTQDADPTQGPAPAQSPTPELPEPEPVSTPIPPQPTPGVVPAPGAPADPSTNEADKRIGVGLDGTLVLPVGAFADATGPLFGPVVRFGYRVIPRLEVAMRAGYLFATSKDQGAGTVARLDLLPVWLFTRFFLLAPFAGPYVAVDVGMNLYLPLREPPPAGPTGDAITEGRWRFGVNAGGGWVISTSFPIDIRAQVVLPNLVGKDDKLERGHIGIGASAGYTLQF